MYLYSGLVSKASIWAYRLWADSISPEEPMTSPPERRGAKRKWRFKGTSISCPGIDGKMVEVHPPLLCRLWFLYTCPRYLLLRLPPPRPTSWSGSRTWTGWRKRCESPAWRITDQGVRLFLSPPPPPPSLLPPLHHSCCRY